ncbi:T7SS effector LXG polymorphic toxin [Gracilibacillus lacisalsi]|uniref:T7SS effector LXG polymorphic toxin n=1 Tax=Gracilibacillus lacisalsi TaxID=393087 RepID=UPI000377700E|nr:T7SS effector LXG polymorphic toxin [Gracilibacillus lacisalsi]
MGHKVDLSEVIDFSDEFKSKSEDIKDSLSKVEQDIEEICNMTTFSGETADQAKLYFRDLHLTVLTTFDGVFTDLYENLNKHIETFQSRVDESSSTIIESNYVRDTMEDVSEDYEALQTHHDSVSSTISSISDISSATTPSFVAIINDKHSVINVGDNLQEDLDSFTTTGRSSNSQTEELLKEIKTTLNNAGAVSGSARFTDYKGDSRTSGLAVLKGYNEGIANSGEVDLESIRYMSMYEIEQTKEDALKDMDETSQKILNSAYTDLKNGKIDRDTYYNIFSTMGKSTKKLSEEELNEEVPKDVIEYLYKNKGKIGLDFIVNFTADSAEHIGKELKMISKKAGKVATHIKSIGELFSTISGKTSGVVTKVGHAAAKTSNHLSDSGKFLLGAGKTLGRSFIAVSAGVGMYEDIFEKDKTIGEAVAHNLTSVGVGLVGGAAGLGLAGLLATNPIGWTVGLGIGLTWSFNYAYDNNVLGLQDGLDAAGQKLSEFGNEILDSAKDAGKAISKGLDAINPMSWAW